jgi:hypothetical protein
VPAIDYDALTDAIDAELATILPPLAADPDVFGFAIFVPEDAGAACLVYTYGNESKMTARPGSLRALDQRYSPIEWISTLPPLRASNDVLETLVAAYEESTREMTDEESARAHDDFINNCARAALTAMTRHRDRGGFGTIWYRVLAMTDSEEAILTEAFETLNDGRARLEADRYYRFDAD